MRKGFNFYRSYYDVAKELNDKDRLAFYDALVKRQFTGVETELTGIAKFAFLSQKHSIDKQIQGYIDKTKDPLLDPSVGGRQGGSVDPSVQVEEKEKEKEEYTIDFEALLQYVNNAFGRNFRVVNNDVKAKYKRLFKNGYEKSDILKAINNCKEDKWHKENNYQYCTLEYFSRPATIDKYSDTTETNTKGIMSHPVIID
jgi:hypothetical protein